MGGATPRRRGRKPLAAKALATGYGQAKRDEDVEVGPLRARWHESRAPRDIGKGHQRRVLGCAEFGVGAGQGVLFRLRHRAGRQGRLAVALGRSAFPVLSLRHVFLCATQRKAYQTFGEAVFWAREFANASGRTLAIDLASKLLPGGSACQLARDSLADLLDALTPMFPFCFAPHEAADLPDAARAA